MKKTIFLVLMMLCIVSTNAQTELAGRTYYNGNIMTGMMDKMMRESEAQMKEKLDNVIAETEKKKGKNSSTYYLFSFIFIYLQKFKVVSIWKRCQ